MATSCLTHRYVTWLLITALVVAGIGTNVVYFVRAATFRHEGNENVTIEDRQGQARSITKQLETDLGIIRPKTNHLHRFEITNDSQSDWTLERIIKSCSCIVANMSATTIQAGHSEYLTMELSAGESSEDVVRSVGIVFQEDRAPMVVLRLRAEIRNEVTVDPPAFFQRVMEGGEVKTFSCVANNYSSAKWDSIQAASTADWLSVRIAPIAHVPRSTSAENLPLQSWQLMCQVDSTGLSTGTKQAFVHLYPFGSNSKKAAATIPVSLSIEPNVEVVPTQLFFGSVTRGNKVIRQLELRFTTLADLPDPNRLAFQHDFGSALALELERAQGKVWILSASYCPGPDEQTGIVRGRVVLDFAYTNKHNVADIKMRDQRLKSVKAVNVSQCIEQSQLSHTTPKYESVEFEVMARILK